MKIILFLFGIILGFTLSFSSKFLPEKKLMEEEEVETINCNDVFILDSVEFANVADSVVRYGDNIAKVPSSATRLLATPVASSKITVVGFTGIATSINCHATSGTLRK